MQTKTLIFIGRSGAGKGTQIKMLKEKLEQDTGAKVLYVESGEGFRKFIATDSYSAEKSRNIIVEGGLQPSFLSVWLWAEQLVKGMTTANEHVIFDGTPRRWSEAKVLESALKFYGLVDPVVIYLEVSREEASKRLTKRGRDDDSEESIIARQNWFEEDTHEALSYLENNPYYRFVRIDGGKSVDEVYGEMCQKLAL